MAPGTQNTHQPGEKQYDPKNDKGQHVRYVYCTQTVQFTRAEIESYVENAAYLINTYPTSFNGQSKEQNLYLYPLRGGTHTRVVMNKKAKEIDANGWIILFTSKNQHLWLLQKQNGKWKVVEDMRASAGSECGGSCKWTTVEYQDSAYGFKWNGYNNSSLNTSKASNAIHNSTTGCDEGVPTSNGCIHMGDKSGQMFKKIVAAGVGIKLIIY